MKSPVFHLLLALLVLAVSTRETRAEVPRKAPLTRYTGLWTNSPFTSKPPPDQAGAAVNPLNDYALLGVSPINGGYRVTLMNRKKTDDRITIDSNSGHSDFKILSVNRKPGNPLGTTVRMSQGRNTGFVSFDEKLLVLKAPARTAPTANAQQNNGQTNNPPQQNPQGTVQPEPNTQQPANRENTNPQGRRPRTLPPSGNSTQNRGQGYNTTR
ncbi:MAG: hypothetical protein QM680_07750 [Luteolibacter sp.]